MLLLAPGLLGLVAMRKRVKQETLLTQHRGQDQQNGPALSVSPDSTIAISTGALKEETQK
jgi:hypothetical protein